MAHTDTWEEFMSKLNNSPLGRGLVSIEDVTRQVNREFGLDENYGLSAPTVIRRVPNQAMNDFRVSASMHEVPDDVA